MSMGVAIMRSVNFEFLRENNEELADLGGFAEKYAHDDPQSSLVKLRQYGENLTLDFFGHFGIPREPGASFYELLDALKDARVVPAVVLSKLHTLRIVGNRGAHGDEVTTRDALGVLEEAFSVGKWFAITVHAAEAVADLRYQTPDRHEPTAAMRRKLAEQESQMQALLEKLEAARKQAGAAEKTAAEQQEILAKANHAASALEFSEEETRYRLIDRQLSMAGWEVGPRGESTDEVGQEVTVQHQPTSSGEGSADYVLWGEDGKPLGVVEAKRTAKNAEDGRKQAALYADGLEKEYGQRPIIFYTNGFDIWVWDDERGERPRRLYGFYNKESLERLVWRREHGTDLKDLGPRTSIVDRPYQIEAVTRVCEHFESKRRRALLVQATGTGKTRVAIALTELLIRARWVKRVLFLCDRRELRKQAKKAYSEHLGSEGIIYVTAGTFRDRSKNIYLATYPAMMKVYQTFDVGFFDLIIADESHRSIYNRYRGLFDYFDGLQVGLTATPKAMITHNTFKMFGCEDGDPTSEFSYQEAVNHKPPYLAMMEVTTHTTKFLRDGIKYSEMTAEQREQLEEQIEDPELVDYEREAIDKRIFNKDTDRRILRNLMDNGERDETGQQIGKTILFARNHDHAIQLQELFEEEYPQYMQPRKPFCWVIDNYETRAEQLIDDFKGEGTNENLTIAISVDMLDTGIDVPEVVNLVFAKPVKSQIKFWQMIGRGTRLCKDLYGPGRDKETFRIFDHWGNFEYFGEDPPEIQPSASKGLLQSLFDQRVQLAELAITKQDEGSFLLATDLLEKDVRSLPDDAIPVRDEWRSVEAMKAPEVIRGFSSDTVTCLRQVISRLMQWRPLSGRAEEYRFDLLIAQTQTSVLRGDSELENYKDDLIQRASTLPINMGLVRDKIDWINRVKSGEFWTNPTVEELDEIRRELRGIMHLRARPEKVSLPPLKIDVSDSSERSEEHDVTQLTGLDLAAYRKRVRGALEELFEEDPVIQRIKTRQPVDEKEIRPLIERAMLKDPGVTVDDLLVNFPSTAKRLDLAIRQVVGLEAEAVSEHFKQFTIRYPSLSAHQQRFLDMIRAHIASYGRLEVADLYEDPFTQIHAEGVDGIFSDDDQIDALLDLIQQLNEEIPAGGTP